MHRQPFMRLSTLMSSSMRVRRQLPLRLTTYSFSSSRLGKHPADRLATATVSFAWVGGHFGKRCYQRNFIRPSDCADSIKYVRKTSSLTSARVSEHFEQRLKKDNRGVVRSGASTLPRPSFDSKALVDAGEKTIAISSCDISVVVFSIRQTCCTSSSQQCLIRLPGWADTQLNV